MIFPIKTHMVMLGLRTHMNEWSLFQFPFKFSSFALRLGGKSWACVRVRQMRYLQIMLICTNPFKSLE